MIKLHLEANRRRLPPAACLNVCSCRCTGSSRALEVPRGDWASCPWQQQQSALDGTVKNREGRTGACDPQHASLTAATGTPRCARGTPSSDVAVSTFGDVWQTHEPTGKLQNGRGVVLPTQACPGPATPRIRGRPAALHWIWLVNYLHLHLHCSLCWFLGAAALGLLCHSPCNTHHVQTNPGLPQQPIHARIAVSAVLDEAPGRRLPHSPCCTQHL